MTCHFLNRNPRQRQIREFIELKPRETAENIIPRIPKGRVIKAIEARDYKPWIDEELFKEEQS